MLQGISGSRARTSISDLVAFDTERPNSSTGYRIIYTFKSGQYLGGRYQIYNDIRGGNFLNLRENSVTNLETWKINTSEYNQRSY